MLTMVGSWYKPDPKGVTAGTLSKAQSLDTAPTTQPPAEADGDLLVSSTSASPLVLVPTTDGRTPVCAQYKWWVEGRAPGKLLPPDLHAAQLARRLAARRG